MDGLPTTRFVRPSAALEAGLADMRPVRTRRPVRTLVTVGTVSVVYAIVLVVWRYPVRPDWATLPVVPFALFGFGCLGAFGILLTVAILPERRQVLPSAARAGRAAIGLLGVLVMLNLASGWLQTESNGQMGSGMCLWTGMQVAAVPALLSLWAVRNSLPTAPWRISLAIGGAASALGACAVHLHCQSPHAAHIWFIHGGILVIPGLLLASVPALAQTFDVV